MTEVVTERKAPEHEEISLKRILTTTHHTDIGILYLTFTLFNFFLAGVAALLVRAELAAPGRTIMGPAIYNKLFTVHGTIMIFLWIIPAFVGFGNWLIPKYIGAHDMYYPKLNALGFWLLVAGSTLIWFGMPNVGWTAYAPLSISEPEVGVDMMILGLHTVGTSSIIGALNFIVTIAKLRKPAITYRNMPLFVWSVLTTSFLVAFGTPVLASALTMLLLDRNLGTTFFLGHGGDPLLWQHLFWFYSHPAVYIMILPGFGLLSEIIPRLARKTIYGYTSMAFSLAAIGFLGFTVWAHHMFTTGMSIEAKLPFMLMTLVIAVPSGIKVFNWIATLYGGRLKLNTAMWFALSAVATFIIAGITGVYTASIPVDFLLQDTYWVVAHLHFMLFGVSTQAVYAAFYYYFPYMTGKMMSERLGKVHLLLTVVGLWLLYGFQLILGEKGMRRRIYDYPADLMPLNLLATIGGFIVAAGAFVFLVNLMRSWIRGKDASPDPWDLAKYGLREFP